MFRERRISRVVVSERGRKFGKYIGDHTPAGPATVKKYVQVLEALLRGKDFSIEDAARYCKRKNRTYVRAALNKYIEFMGHLGELPEWGPGSAEHLKSKLPRVHEPAPRSRSLPAREELVEVVKRLDGDYRRAALFIFYTGARISEAMDLRLRDVDFEAGEATIYVKHKVEKAPRTVKPPREYLEELKAHVGKLGILGPEHVFLPDSKASLRSRVDMFNQKFKRECLDVMGRSVGSHEFRRFAGTRIYEETRDIKLVRDFLGHADVRTTMKYTEYADKNTALERGRDIMAQGSGEFNRESRANKPVPGARDG